MTHPLAKEPPLNERLPLDLEAAQRAINGPHVIELRADGWTIMHPLACRPHLFDCPVNRAAERDLTEPAPPGNLGRYECWTAEVDRFHIGAPTETDPTLEVDVGALVDALRGALAKLAAVQQLLDTSPFGPTRAQARLTLFEIRQAVTGGSP